MPSFIHRLKAYAKVNLTLEVLGRRPDGYHEIRSVMQTIDLWDELTVERSSELKIICSDPAIDGPDNLVARAARLLIERYGVTQGAQITLTKGIPLASGLGGGSSDAAATLKGLNEMWGLGLSQQMLIELGPSLGSDVPFFILGGTALVKGRGEKVEPLRACGSLNMVLFTPKLDVPQKTATLYRKVKDEHFGTGQKTELLSSAISRGELLRPEWLFNVFEEVADELFPSLPKYRRAFREVGSGEVHLAGSGPTIFALVSSQSAGEEVAKRLRREGIEARAVTSRQ